MIKKSIFRRIILAILFALIAGACANIVAPTGGPIDEDPPVVLRSTPPNYSTHYKGQDVRIFFDEFVELKNLRQNLLVSPPLAKDPEVRVRGRSIIMSVEDTLAPNTTYNFFFGESIVDITEGNPIPNFQFVVSTGSYVDSLSVAGSVVNALTLEPEEGIFVMMYDDVFDSVPMLERPVYLSKTDKDGNFFISNMRDGEYLMFALKDMNSNYLYDNPDEKIAFLDSLVRPEYAGLIRTGLPEESLTGEGDTINLNDTLSRERISQDLISENDTVHLSDTLAIMPEKKITHYQLYLFQEKDTTQRLLSTSLVRKGRIDLVFRIPPDSVILEDYREPLPDQWLIKESNKRGDTISFWFTDIERDSLFLKVFDRERLIDSTRVSLVPRVQRGRGAPREEEPAALSISTPTVSARKHDYYKRFTLLSQTPIRFFNPDSVEFFINDTIPVQLDFEFTDPANRRLELTQLLEKDTTYRMFFPPGSMEDIFGNTNDTLRYSFRTTSPENYGAILVNLQLPDKGDDQEYILELLNDKWERVSEKIISENRIYRFEHLPAAHFRIRLVHDRNKNGEWDTGSYLEGIQPETVFIYPDRVQTRINWEVEVLWDASPD